MNALAIATVLSDGTPRAASIWRAWLATSSAVPDDRDEALAAFARYLLIDSERANDHPRIVGSALAAVAGALQATDVAKHGRHARVGCPGRD